MGRLTLRTIGAALAALALLCVPARAQEGAPAAQYQNFRAAIYVVVNSTRALADRATFEREFERVFRQVRFDKVYLEVYRNRNFASDEEIERAIANFRERGIIVAGGITPAAGGSGGQFGTFDYENADDMAECRRAVELAARHFDEVILDDFFFYTSKSEADIAARGARSWTQYRLDTMRRASQECVIGPARALNPDIRLIIKYPNWYEHFQGTGYDLEQQSRIFDAIYTGTETRDPEITDQLLQQYESYEIFRYFENIRPGANLGGWVDTFDTRYVDRYAEQLWLTLFAKAPEITLFNWAGMASARALAPGARPWARRPTSFDWRAMTGSYRSRGRGDPGPGWGRAAGYALERVDADLAALGAPIGIAAYKPYHSVGEDFLHNYLGNIGVPIELHPEFPEAAPTVLLTESAAADPDIIARMQTHLVAGKNLVVTSGFVCARPDIDRIVELDCTGRRALIGAFINGFGAGAGGSLNEAGVAETPVLFPEIRFFTNDSWPIIRGVANARGFPIMLMNRYASGVIFVLNVPDNPGDLYNLPTPLLTQIKTYVMGDFPVRLEAPPRVALFAYDNDALVVHSFRDAPVEVTLSIIGAAPRVRNLSAGAELAPVAPAEGQRAMGAPRTRFTATIEPHSYQVFRIGE